LIFYEFQNTSKKSIDPAATAYFILTSTDEQSLVAMNLEVYSEAPNQGAGGKGRK